MTEIVQKNILQLDVAINNIQLKIVFVETAKFKLAKFELKFEHKPCEAVPRQL